MTKSPCKIKTQFVAGQLSRRLCHRWRVWVCMYVCVCVLQTYVMGTYARCFVYSETNHKWLQKKLTELSKDFNQKVTSMNRTLNKRTSCMNWSNVAHMELVNSFRELWTASALFLLSFCGNYCCLSRVFTVVLPCPVAKITHALH